MEPRDEMIRRSASRYSIHGGVVYFHGDGAAQQPATPRPPSKDWTKIETYWPHLAKPGGAVAPRPNV